MVYAFWVVIWSVVFPAFFKLQDSRDIADSPWAAIEEGLGSVNLDGTPRIECVLTNDVVLSALDLRVVMRTVVSTDAFGKAQSSWQSTGLNTFLAPLAHDSLVWHTLAGTKVYFRTNLITRRFTNGGVAGHWIKKTGERDYLIADPFGRTWKYKGGLLESISHPLFGTFDVMTRGANILSVRKKGGDALLLSAIYDEDGHLLSLETEQGNTASLAWTQNVLRSIGSRIGLTVRYGYNDGLITAVKKGNAAPIRIEWTIRSKGLSYSRDAAPAQIAAYANERFRITYDQSGMIIDRFDSTSRCLSRTIVNPKMGVVTQKDFSNMRFLRRKFVLPKKVP